MNEWAIEQANEQMVQYATSQIQIISTQSVFLELSTGRDSLRCIFELLFHAAILGLSRRRQTEFWVTWEENPAFE